MYRSFQKKKVHVSEFDSGAGCPIRQKIKQNEIRQGCPGNTPVTSSPSYCASGNSDLALEIVK
jgi:hypothetical protein